MSAPDPRWLLKLAWPSPVLDVCSGGAARHVGGCAWYSLDGTLAYMYTSGDQPLFDFPAGAGDVYQVWLTPRTWLDGVSHASPARYHYVVETDVDAAFEDEFNAWYDEEHLPGLAAVPGTVRAIRYVDEAGSPRYYACYDLTCLEALTSPAWLAVRATPWSSRVRPVFINTRRTAFRAAA